MSIFQSKIPLAVTVPDDVTVVQFVLDHLAGHSTRPTRAEDVPCFIDENTGTMVFIEELRSRTDALARGLNGTWRIGRDDVVALCAPNHIDYAVAVSAAQRLGAIVALISPSLTPFELVYQFQIVQPALIITHTDCLPGVLEAASSVGFSLSSIVSLDRELSESGHTIPSVGQIIQRSIGLPPFYEYRFSPGQAKEKIAFLLFSSGTTGMPKAVAVSHYNIICSVLQTATFTHLNEDGGSVDDKRYRPGDKCAAVVPFYHTYGLVANLLFCIYAAMTIIVSQKFVYEDLLRSIERYRITHLFLVPPQVVLFCKHPSTRKYDLSSIHCFTVAAAPLSAELTSQLLELLPQVQLGQLYGLTETCAVTLSPTSQRVGTPGSAGQLVSGTLAKVVKLDGSLAAVGEPGELHVKGGQISLGYYRDEKATRDNMIDGWFRTGDEVVIHENGDVFITDRMKELIKVKGFQVAPAELEGHLLSHPQVSDAGVIGIPDDYAGEVPLAFIVLRPDVAAAVHTNTALAEQVRSSIFKHVSEAKSQYKWLTGGIEFIEAVPKSPSGKILRRVLREHAKSISSVIRSRL